MKKFLFILTFLFLISCLGPSYVTKFKQDYSQTQRELLYQDLRNAQFLFDIDSVDFDDWIFTQAETKKGYKIERAYILKDAPKHEFLFVYTTFVEKDTVYFEFEILERGKYNF